MITRYYLQTVKKALTRQSAVVLIGPRQVGKTTLSLEILKEHPGLYLDLESTLDRNKLADPVLFLQAHQDKLVILDEIHRAPDLFQSLRGVIDERRRIGKRTGQFLILGSASIDLLRQSSETLAGRIEYIEMPPIMAFEINKERASIERLWLRGGFPDSYLAATDIDSFNYRLNFIRTYLERDIPQFGHRIPAELLERLWTMLAHQQGTLLNSAQLATSLSISAPTVAHYISLLVDLLLVRRLLPYWKNVGKRLVKSPKIYIRDSGVVHTLLGIQNLIDLSGHPVVGFSWEGFVIESLIAAAPLHTKASFYRTSAGAEVDLLLEIGGNCGLYAIEIKRSLSAIPSRGLHEAIKVLQPTRTFIVTASEEHYLLTENIQSIGLQGLCNILLELHKA